MKLAILGTGAVGRTLAASLEQLGHQVMIGTRNVENTLTHTQQDNYGNLPFSAWHPNHAGIRLGTFQEAAAFGEVVFNCLNGNATLAGLAAAGAENLAGKILVDIANPLDFSNGRPPSLFVANTDSLGEQIQAAFPEAKVVKTLNTVNCEVMVNAAKSAEQDKGTAFVSGNDAAAKASVTSNFLRPWGWEDVIDLGDISTARGTEMLIPLWVRTWAATGNGHFAFKVVR